LTPEAPLTLTWDNGEGLRFSQTFAVDDNYLFTLTRRVENHGSSGVSLWPYGLISRVGEGDPIELQFSGYLVHIGAAGAIEGTLEEIDYDDLREDGRQSFETTGGWAGFVDKYWLVALAPDQAEHVNASFSATQRGELNKYQVDMRGAAQSLAPGGEIEVTEYLLAGAKKVTLFDDYEETYGISNLDGVVFKFLWFMAKPLFYALNFFHELWGNFGLAILSLTVCVRLVLFPLANKSYKAMSKMKQLGPQVTKLRERHKDDKPRLNQEMMALYKREKVNPMAGCLPILLQIPVFFALYSVLFVSIDMRHAPFFGWIRDLSAPDPYSIFNLFGLIPIDLPQFLMIGPWPLMMGITMWLQFKLNPTPPEPIQAKIMMFLPIIFTFILASFPAGLVIYWTWNNCLSIAQQWIIMRRMGVKIGGGGKT
jgi:YidC/Oxa1 family membrane protein insertase